MDSVNGNIKKIARKYTIKKLVTYTYISALIAMRDRARAERLAQEAAQNQDSGFCTSVADSGSEADNLSLPNLENYAETNDEIAAPADEITAPAEEIAAPAEEIAVPAANDISQGISLKICSHERVSYFQDTRCPR